MAFEDWLNRKANHHAHNEMFAFLTMILGMNFLIGGLVMTANTTLGFSIINQLSSTLPSVIGFVLSIIGVFVLLSGFLLVLCDDRKRAWHIGEIEKADRLRNRKIRIAEAEELLKELLEPKSSERDMSRALR
jgi:hypothetical protein